MSETLALYETETETTTDAPVKTTGAPLSIAVNVTNDKLLLALDKGQARRLHRALNELAERMYVAREAIRADLVAEPFHAQGYVELIDCYTNDLGILHGLLRDVCGFAGCPAPCPLPIVVGGRDELGAAFLAFAEEREPNE